MAGDGIEFFNGVSYRHLMVWRNGVTGTKLTPPHDITGKPVEQYLPQGEGADRLIADYAPAGDILREHRVNQRAPGGGQDEPRRRYGSGARASAQRYRR